MIVWGYLLSKKFELPIEVNRDLACFAGAINARVSQNGKTRAGIAIGTDVPWEDVNQVNSLYGHLRGHDMHLEIIEDQQK